VNRAISLNLGRDRTHNTANEITDTDATTGTNWVDPIHDAAGNMTRIPRVSGPSSNYLLTYDAWNRVVKIESGAGSPVPIGDYAYDGLHRRVSRTMYVSGTPSFTRRMYYSDQWQVLEERQFEDPDWLLHKQYVWGIRYIDELVLRDQDTSNPPNGTLNQRHYALQDANFNVVAIVNNIGDVSRRFDYDAYGHSTTLEADYSPGAYEYDFEYRYAGYRWDYETQLLQVRNRWYHPRLGRWVSRDPIGYDGGSWNLYEYVGGGPLKRVDSLGLQLEELLRTLPPPTDSKACCGLDATRQFALLMVTLEKEFKLLTEDDRYRACKSLVSSTGWDIEEFYLVGGANGRATTGQLGKFTVYPCGAWQCQGTVTLFGECHKTEDANYYLWGLARGLCDTFFRSTYGTYNVTVPNDFNDNGGTLMHYYDIPWAFDFQVWTLESTLWYVKTWRSLAYGDKNPTEKIAWTEAGWYESPSKATKVNINAKCPPCDNTYIGSLSGHFGQKDNRPIVKATVE
jgi:RHS repeat-associated protein